MFTKNIGLKLLAFILIISFSFLSFTDIARADNVGFSFVKQIGGTSGDFEIGSARDTDGNLYITGYFSGTADFDPGAGTANLTSNGNSDVFIVKLDPLGNYIWAKNIGGSGFEVSGTNIVVDQSGNVYVNGSFASTVDMDPGAGTANLTDAGNGDAFVLKLDTNGNYVWAKDIAAGSGDGAVQGIYVDSNYNVYTTGYFSGTVDMDPGAGTANLTSAGSDDPFISKLDSSGNLVWAKRLGGGGYDSALGIAVDSNDNVYTTGNFRAVADFDPGAGAYNLTPSGGAGDAFVSKLDSSGNFVWAVQIAGASTEIGYDLALDSNSNVYTTGIMFSNPADFDPGAGTYNLLPSNGNGYLWKLDKDGNFVWARNFGAGATSLPHKISVDSSTGSLYDFGSFIGSGDFDPGAGTTTLTSAGSNDLFVSKYDLSGNLIWVKSIGGTGDDEDGDVNYDSSSNLYISGYFNGTADFDPGTGTANLTSAGTQDGFLLKLSPITTGTVTSSDATDMTQTTATLNGNITDTGGAGTSVTARGFQWGTTNSYGTNIDQTSGAPYSTGTFSASLTDLTCATRYYFRPYVTNSEGTTYGTETNFTTSNCPRKGSSGISGGGSTGGGSSYTPPPTAPTAPVAPTPPTAPTPPATPTPPDTTCGIYSDKFLKKGIDNDKETVKKIQTFLNDYMKAALEVDGIFGDKTETVLKAFQLKEKTYVLDPWKLDQPTGVFYKTTQTRVNNIMCPSLNLPIPGDLK